MQPDKSIDREQLPILRLAQVYIYIVEQLLEDQHYWQEHIERQPVIGC